MKESCNRWSVPAKDLKNLENLCCSKGQVQSHCFHFFLFTALFSFLFLKHPHFAFCTVPYISLRGFTCNTLCHCIQSLSLKLMTNRSFLSVAQRKHLQDVVLNMSGCVDWPHVHHCVSNWLYYIKKLCILYCVL